MNQIEIIMIIRNQFAESLRFEFQAQHPMMDLDSKEGLKAFNAYQAEVVAGLMDLFQQAYDEDHKEASHG